MEMYFFEDLYVTCEECGGKRYKPEVLRISYKGKNVNEILNMTVDEALDFFFRYSSGNRQAVIDERHRAWLSQAWPACNNIFRRRVTENKNLL